MSTLIRKTKARWSACLAMLAALGVLASCGSPDDTDDEAAETREDGLKLAASSFVPVKWRALDTRDKGLPLGPGQEIVVPIGAPGTADFINGVAVTLTVTGAHGDGFLAAYGAGTKWSGTSNLNYVHGQTVSNTAVVMINDTASIVVKNVGGDAHVIVDVQGFFDPLTQDSPGNVCSRTSRRLFDSRATGDKVPAGQWFYLSNVAPYGEGLVNVTVTEPDGDGYVSLGTVDAKGQLMDETTPPTTSVANFLFGETRATSAFADYFAGLAFYTSVRSHLIIDEMVAFDWKCADPQALYITSPHRVFDTRSYGGPVSVASFGIESPAVSKSASGILGNITLLNASGTTYVGDMEAGGTSIVNADVGQVTANFGQVSTWTLDGWPAVSVGNPNIARQDIVVDTFGYIAP